jgi:hypothetical protein
MSAKAAASTTYEQETATRERAQPVSRERQHRPDLSSAEPALQNRFPEDGLAQQNSPAHELIARRAYECWMERGCPDGSPEVDWFHAEQELREAPGSARLSSE